MSGNRKKISEELFQLWKIYTVLHMNGCRFEPLAAAALDIRWGGVPQRAESLGADEIEIVRWAVGVEIGENA